MYFSVFLLLIVITGVAESQWTVQSSGTSSNLKSIFFINLQTGFSAGTAGTMIKTTNGGANWSPLTTGLSVDINSVCFINSNSGFACANGGNLIMTTNSGLNWSPVTSGVTDNLYAISFSGSTNGVCSGSGGTLLFTSNGGLSWTIAANGFLSSYYGVYMFDPNTAYAGGVNTIFQPLLARTSNGGANWTYSAFYLNSNEGNLRDFYFFTANEGIAVSNIWDGRGGISYTTNSGLNWTTQFNTNALYSIDFSGSTGYSAGLNGNIIKSTNAGASWQSQTSGVSAILRCVEFIDSLTGYICGDGGVILKTTNGGVTSVHNISNDIPGEFTLNQNYPNPFNPSTKIRFSIPAYSASERIRIRVFSGTGSEVADLFEGRLNSGTYELSWDAGNYPSGVYYCSIQTDKLTRTIRMVLVK